MIQYTSQHQTYLPDCGDLYELALDPTNRWIQLADLLPWDRMVGLYAQRMNRTQGAPAINPRWIIGAMIIKHKLKLGDEQTLQLISENPYMQRFLGLRHYHPQPLFSPSLLVAVRKRIGKALFDEFLGLLVHPHKVATNAQADQAPELDKSAKRSNKGHLKLDATVADQYIRYPNDLGLLNEAREKTEKLIDLLFEQGLWHGPAKPRTYRKLAHKRYVAMAKKKRVLASKRRMEIRYQLNCVARNLGHLQRMVEVAPADAFPLSHGQQRTVWIIQTLVGQQREMYEKRLKRCDHRIVSLHQPHVRPIVRGKMGRKVEFGAKLGLSLAEGYLANEVLSWDAYYEGDDLPAQVNAYHALYGHYPELLQVDKAYRNDFTRQWCKERGIRMTDIPRGRPAQKTAAQKRKQRDEYAQRNQIEGRIGQAKQALSLNQIKARLKETSEAWIGATLFTLNLSHFAKTLGLTF